MSSDRTTERGADSELRRFERNRFFNGKLMTARDMKAEQEYHRNRTNTLARLVAGTGILSGLETTVEGDGDRLEVTVEPGVAVDHAGRLIVVPKRQTQQPPDGPPTDDVVYVYLTYEENCSERVPKPGSDAVSEEDCDYNRILETFAVRFGSSPPKTTTERIAEIASSEDSRPKRVETPGEITRWYHGKMPTMDDGGEESAIFLGGFEWGSWEPVESEKRPLVYTNDVLYAALAHHISDFGNPHNVSADGTGARPSGGLSEAEVIEIVESELASRELESVERAEALERYVMQRSLLEKEEAFVRVGQRFQNHAVGSLADEILETTTRALEDNVFDDEADYRGFVEDVSGREEEIADIVEREERSTEEVRERYRSAVDHLKDELGGDASVLRLVIAQDAVCVAAKHLERPVNV